MRSESEPGGEKPKDEPSSEPKPEPGTNVPSADRPDDPKERVENAQDAQGWGYLPKSLDFLKHRGGSPTVPERYRKFREAYLKQGKQQNGKDK